MAQQAYKRSTGKLNVEIFQLRGNVEAVDRFAGNAKTFAQATPSHIHLLLTAA